MHIYHYISIYNPSLPSAHGAWIKYQLLQSVILVSWHGIASILQWFISSKTPASGLDSRWAHVVWQRTFHLSLWGSRWTRSRKEGRGVPQDIFFGAQALELVRSNDEIPQGHRRLQAQLTRRRKSVKNDHDSMTAGPLVILPLHSAPLRDASILTWFVKPTLHEMKGYGDSTVHDLFLEEAIVNHSLWGTCGTAPLQNHASPMMLCVQDPEKHK